MKRTAPVWFSAICTIGTALGCSRPAPPAALPLTARPQVTRDAEKQAMQLRELRATTLEAGKSYEKADLKDVDVSGQVLDEPVDRFLASAMLDGSKMSAVKWQVGKRAFYDARLVRTDWSNAVVACGDSAFQRSHFGFSQLPGATLTGGVGAFQLARFDGANLVQAELTGGGCAFQGASFRDANLQGAKLTGTGAAFQSASFANANLVEAVFSCGGFTDFQGAILDGARFQHADLSSITPSSLRSCQFAKNDPPRYDAATRFPAGFDPVEAGWANADRS